jgi:cysteine-rich repeat protein
MKMPVAVSAALVSCLFAVSPAIAQVCGDDVRDPGEQCDDGNTHNTDGCDASCQFEQTHKLIDLNIERTPGTCPANRFGGAFTLISGSAGQTNAGIDASIAAGTTAILLQFLGLEDPAADDDAGLEVGILSSLPVRDGPATYNGNAPSDLDWWYTPDPAALDPARQPISRLAGTLTAGALATTPGQADIRLIIGGGPATLSLSSLTLNASIGADNTPLTSTGFTPGHLPAEDVDPALQSFATAGTGATGLLCGDISAQSLANTPIPPVLITTCTTQAYTLANKLLDVFVNGCSAGPLPVIAATQPDPARDNPAAPPTAAGGPPYVFTVDVNKTVTACTASGNPAVLSECLADAVYSSRLTFTSQRVIARDDLIFGDDFEAGA